MFRKALYPECAHLKHAPPEIEVSEDVKKSLQEDFRVLPVYESRRADYVGVRKYSMKRYPSLACGWIYYQKAYFEREKKPFEFPRRQDFHYYNCNVIYDPRLTPDYNPDHRLKMRPGPGVDRNLRQLPIPNDTSLRPKALKSAILKHNKTLKK